MGPASETQVTPKVSNLDLSFRRFKGPQLSRYPGLGSGSQGWLKVLAYGLQLSAVSLMLQSREELPQLAFSFPGRDDDCWLWVRDDMGAYSLTRCVWDGGRGLDCCNCSQGVGAPARVGCERSSGDRKGVKRYVLVPPHPGSRKGSRTTLPPMWLLPLLFSPSCLHKEGSLLSELRPPLRDNQGSRESLCLHFLETIPPPALVVLSLGSVWLKEEVPRCDLEASGHLSSLQRGRPRWLPGPLTPSSASRGCSQRAG